MRARRLEAIAREAKSITTRARRCCTSRSASCRWSWTGSKKKLPSSIEVKRAWIEPEHPQLSVRRQCLLLELNRATFYDPPGSESRANLTLMRRIDEQYLRTPFYGSRRMAEVLGTKRRPLNRKRVQRLMRLMGLEAIYPKPRTTQRDTTHTIYPY